MSHARAAATDQKSAPSSTRGILAKIKNPKYKTKYLEIESKLGNLKSRQRQQNNASESKQLSSGLSTLYIEGLFKHFISFLTPKEINALLQINSHLLDEALKLINEKDLFNSILPVRKKEKINLFATEFKHSLNNPTALEYLNLIKENKFQEARDQLATEEKELLATRDGERFFRRHNIRMKCHPNKSLILLATLLFGIMLFTTNMLSNDKHELSLALDQLLFRNFAHSKIDPFSTQCANLYFPPKSNMSSLLSILIGIVILSIGGSICLGTTNPTIATIDQPTDSSALGIIRNSRRLLTELEELDAMKEKDAATSAKKP